MQLPYIIVEICTDICFFVPLFGLVQVFVSIALILGDGLYHFLKILYFTGSSMYAKATNKKLKTCKLMIPYILSFNLLCLLYLSMKLSLIAALHTSLICIMLQLMLWNDDKCAIPKFPFITYDIVFTWMQSRMIQSKLLMISDEMKCS